MKLYPECFISTCQCEALRQASAECQTSAPLNSSNKHCSCFGGGHHIRKIPGGLSFLVLPPSRLQGPAPRGAGKGNRAMGSQSWAASLPDRAGARTVANPVSSLLPSGCLPGVRHSHQCLSLDQPQRRFSERCSSLGHTCDHACQTREESGRWRVYIPPPQPGSGEEQRRALSSGQLGPGLGRKQPS